MISQRKLDGMRRMHAEFLHLLDLAERGDAEAADQVAVFGGALVGFCCHSWTRLSREPERTVIPKLDRFGGSA